MTRTISTLLVTIILVLAASGQVAPPNQIRPNGPRNAAVPTVWLRAVPFTNLSLPRSRPPRYAWPSTMRCSTFGAFRERMGQSVWRQAHGADRPGGLDHARRRRRPGC